MQKVLFQNFLILFLSFVLNVNFAQVNNDSLNSILSSLSPKEKISFLGEQCWKYREIDTEQSIFFGKKALRIADSLNIDHDVAKICNFVGVAHIHYKFGLKHSIKYFHQALEVGLRTKDTIQIAYAYNNLGDAFYVTGNMPLSLEYSNTALELFRKLDSQKGIAYSYINLAVIFRFEKKFSLSHKYLKDVINIRTEISDKMGVASAYLEIAKTFTEEQKYDSALLYYNKSLDLQSALDNKSYMAQSLVGLGSINYAKENYTNAVMNFKEAFNLFDARNLDYWIISSKLGLALCYSKINRRKEGENELNEALTLSKKIGILSKVMDTYETYAKFYMNVKDIEASTNSFNKFTALYDSLYSVNQYEILNEIQSKFLITQRLNQSKQQLEIEKTKELSFFIISSLMLIIVIILVWRNFSTRKLNNELAELNNSKEKLFSIIAHDLRNPFYSLMSFLDLMKTGELTTAERDDIIKNMDITTSNTYQLLENLLNLSSSRTGKIDFLPVKINIKDPIFRQIKLLQTQLKLKKIELSTSFAAEELTVDPNMFEIIIRNLITNAIKYSKENGQIFIRSYEENGIVKVSVSDKGIGMNDNIKKQLFNSDFVKSTWGTAGEKGTGLGLGLCKEFIEKHNGKITVKSEIGVGSEFVISF